jgi:hypothetical protein
MTDETIEWVRNPELRNVKVEHGKGKSIVTGVIKLLFQGEGRVFVTTEAHHNDDLPCIEYRGHEWLVTDHFIRHADGTCTVKDDDRWTVCRRGIFGGGENTPPTHRTAILDAIAATVAREWTPELDRQGAYAEAMQGLSHAVREQQKARAKLAEIDEEVNVLRAKAAKYQAEGD